MDFGLSEEQQLLEQTLRAFLADQIPISRVRALRGEDCPNDRPSGARSPNSARRAC